MSSTQSLSDFLFYGVVGSNLLFTLVIIISIFTDFTSKTLDKKIIPALLALTLALTAAFLVNEFVQTFLPRGTEQPKTHQTEVTP